MRPHRDEREQAKRGGRCSGNRRIRPLALGLDAGVAPDFGEGDLNGPTTDKLAEDVDWIGFEIGTEECLRPQFS